MDRQRNPAATDQQVLRTASYADSGALRSRASVYDWKVPKVDIVRWVLDHVPWPAGATVLDVGCGAGQYSAALARQGDLRLVAADLSDGMAREAGAAAGAAGLVADAQAIPLADGSIDAALAIHMLYHCADPDRAVAELRRIVAPGGVVLVVTNGDHHAYRDLIDAAAGAPLPNALAAFTIANGEPVLRRHFESVAVHPLDGELRVPEADAVLAYVDSTRSWYESSLPSGATWADVQARARAIVEEQIAAQGVHVAPTRSALFVCS